MVPVNAAKVAERGAAVTGEWQWWAGFLVTVAAAFGGLAKWVGSIGTRVDTLEKSDQAAGIQRAGMQGEITLLERRINDEGKEAARTFITRDEFVRFDDRMAEAVNRIHSRLDDLPRALLDALRSQR